MKPSPATDLILIVSMAALGWYAARSLFQGHKAIMGAAKRQKRIILPPFSPKKGGPSNG